MGGAALPATLALQGGAGAYSAWQQGQAGKSAASYYSYLANTSRINAGLAESAGKSKTQEIGAEEFDMDRRLGEHIRATVGSQRVAVAAGGVGGASKTAEQIVSDTMTKGNIDEIALRYNAALKTKAAQTGADTEAFNDISQAGGDELSGINARSAARMNQVGTILGTGASVTSNWYRSRTRSPGYLQ